MALKIKNQHRGAVPRKLKSITRQATKDGLLDAAVYFHTTLRDRRFTHAHARAAGYWQRKPSYLKQKKRKVGHTRPLEFSGKTRTLIKTQYRLSSTSNRGVAAYAGARTFNRRHRESSVNMRQDFERILPEEAEQFATIVDRRLEAALAAD
ncbi:hypothetical protein [Roseiconus lacunae]|uniref:Phage virion morphogenesis protein n=1 Tax=Roseiconus lacunae TaxID=2605694 RepID=A0ABT7PI47_9BACT|nr:hypothetical protein [Roseiconus lacunae]MDM4015856.1 hypothetical protein [Roseiconus lacunae]